MDKESLEAWVGRERQAHDVVVGAPLARLSATLDRDDPQPAAGDVVPPLWHWLYFLPQAPMHDIGPDGHEHRGHFLPPVPLPRRMWAGGRFVFAQPLHVGEAITRRSRIRAIETKQGRGGALVFVTVEHAIHGEHGLALTEEHDIVYRTPALGADPAPPRAAPADAAFERELTPDPVLLFRYSALTFNSHRIHYDRSYACDVEGYPGLVVHGPLIATLLLDLLRRQEPAAVLRRFEFKATRPVFDNHRFSVCGRIQAAGDAALWARDHSGALAMQARAEFV